MNITPYTNDAVALLQKLISIPRTSRDETKAADLLEQQLHNWGIACKRDGNNIWCICSDYQPEQETILLNAHIDTVKPVNSWTRNPFVPSIEGDTIYGLGSNDCGGGLVSLLMAFRILTDNGRRQTVIDGRKYNLIYLASAEEEVSGQNGISSVLPLLPPISVAIVGEPTSMQPAVAEKGLMVIDMKALGKSGHAARGEGINAIYQMLDDLTWIRNYRFEKVSEFLGPTQMQVTVINAGTQHNVVPDVCSAIIDVRTNELYTNEEVFELIRNHVQSEVKARSFRLHSSCIDTSQPLIRKLEEMGKKPFGSPTLSDQALMPFPSFKLGPGDSCRSHSADEFIKIKEIQDAIETYLNLLRS